MPIIHRVFRREFGLLPKMIRAVPAGDAVRSGRVAEYARELLSALHQHHTHEDELLWPKLNARVTLEKPLVERMEEQHAAVAELITRAEQQLPGWASSADQVLGEALATTIDEMSTSLNEHLHDEEERILPVCEQHITEGEWEELGKAGMGSIPKKRLLVQLGYILEDTDAKERARFLAKVPFPGRLAYRLIGERRYRAETSYFRAGIG
jgi:hemerythrin-like domain-containing protein